MQDETSGNWGFNEEDETVTNAGAFIDNLKQVGQLLHSNYLQNLLKSCQDKDDNIRQLRIANVNLRNEINGLKSSQQTFQKRSDEYKEKFQNAQTAIEELHQKNRKLLKNFDALTQKIASQQIAAQHDTGHPLFEKPHSVKAAKVIVLAPDTCQVDTHPILNDNEHETIIIEDDEDVIHEESKTKENICTVLNADKDGVNDLENSVNDFDNDETMFIKPLPLDTEMPDYTIDMDETHFDDIPSSPVLEQKKHSRFLTPKIPKKVENVCASADGKRLTSTTPLKDISMLLNSSTEASPSVLPPTFKCSAPVKPPATSFHDTFETSLNDLFDKTDGDLDTTAANLEQTYQKSQHSKTKSEIDFDLDNDDFMPSKHERINKNAVVKKYEKVIQIEKSPHSDKENEEIDFCTNDKSIKGNKKVSPKRKTNISPRTLWMSDFDKLPKREKPNFKHKTVVKNRDKRSNLDGKTCAQCEAFYSDLSAEKRKEMLRNVCKHKFVYQPPSTPEHYWDVDIPSTIECRERGYIIDKSQSSKREKFRRRKR